MATEVSAATFVERLKAHQSDDELRKIQRYFKSGEGEYGEGDQFMGVKMGQVFTLAKEFIAMPPAEIEKLLDSPIHEVRAGALSIMDKQARRQKMPDAERKVLYDLYLRRIDRINNWDLVDLAAIFVIGGYLYGKDTEVLAQLAHSENLWERRTAIVATYYWIRQNEVEETFKIADILLHDREDLIHKAVGGGLRWAGDKELPRLLAFLDQHAATMPRTMLRYAIEHLDKAQREHYMGLKKS